MILALTVAGLLRVLSPTGDAALAFTLSADATFFRLDAATYALAPSCVKPKPSGPYRCVVPLLGAEIQTTPHRVTPCATSGSVTTCGLFAAEANVRGTCELTSSGGGCPDELFPQPAPVPPVNLSAAAVSSSEIRVSWTPADCNSGFAIERATAPGGPWIEIKRIPPP